MQFGRGAILHGMRHIDRCSCKADGIALLMEGIFKFRGQHQNAGKTTPIQIAQVVRTARRTGPSIGKRNHNNLTFGGDALQ